MRSLFCISVLFVCIISFKYACGGNRHCNLTLSKHNVNKCLAAEKHYENGKKTKLKNAFQYLITNSIKDDPSLNNILNVLNATAANKSSVDENVNPQACKLENNADGRCTETRTEQDMGLSTLSYYLYGFILYRLFFISLQQI